jgi:plastocyanin
VFAFAACAALVVPACEGSDVTATCEPSGSELSIAVLASNTHHFTTDCLAAPAGRPFTIAFENGDTSDHGDQDVHITDGSATLFQGDLAENGTSITYHVDALQAGSYRFRCDNHPTLMYGAFIVQ